MATTSIMPLHTRKGRAGGRGGKKGGKKGGRAPPLWEGAPPPVWWATRGSNPDKPGYEPGALTNYANGPFCTRLLYQPFPEKARRTARRQGPRPRYTSPAGGVWGTAASFLARKESSSARGNTGSR